MSITLADAIKSLRPDNGFVLLGETVSGIEWVDGQPTKPITQVEAEKEIKRLEGLLVSDNKQKEADRIDAIAHAKSLGFTDAMIAVMYPNLVTS